MQKNNKKHIVTNWLVDSGVIKKEETELYDYAITSLMLLITPFVLTLLIGIVLGYPLEAIVMVIPFMTLRKFCGGLHLRKLYICLILSIVLLSISLLLAIVIETLSLWYCIYIIDGVIIIIKCPLEDINKKISYEQKNRYKKISIIQWIVYLVVITALIFIKWFDLAKCIMSGVTLTSVMMIIGSLVNSIKTRRINHEKK